MTTSSALRPTTLTSSSPSPKLVTYSMTGGVTSTVTTAEVMFVEAPARLTARQVT